LKVSLIVTTYNWPKALKLVLKSALEQIVLPNEIIVADDGSAETTKKTIQTIAEQSPIPILHAWQEDKGFRAAMARNRAIAMACGEYIVMIDGDMLLHPFFIKDHLDNAEKNRFIQGSRVLLDQEITNKILSTGNINLIKKIKYKKNAYRIKPLSKLFLKKSLSMRGIKTCNFSLFREDIIKVNGFDNTFVGWGREDSEFVARLYNAGMERKNLKFCAIAYHLYHPEHERDALPENDRKLKRSIEEGIVSCTNGINQFIYY